MTMPSPSGAEPAQGKGTLADGASTAGADLFSIEWQREPAPLPASAPAGGRWAIVAEEGDVIAHDLASRLSHGRQSCRLSTFEAIDEVLPAEYVVCMWPPGDGAQAGGQGSLRLMATALRVVQRLMRGTKRPLRLVWVTRGAQAVTPRERVTSVASAALWGLGGAFTQEHPELPCALVDVEPHEGVVGDLLAELERRDDETDIAWRGGERYVARLLPVTEAPSRAASPGALRTQGTVMITGGLGELGLGVARSFAERGVEHLLLTGRRGMQTPGAERVVAELEGLGARVTVVGVDVADRDAVAEVLTEIPPSLPLRGIIHCAGVLDRALLCDLDTDRAALVMRPKALGGWHLHELSRGLDLDSFVLFSSISSRIVAGGLGLYAAANAFLDALAAHRRGEGLPGQSLGWGLVTNASGRGAGVAADFDRGQVRRATRDGMRSITVEQAMARFPSVIARPEVHLIPVSIDLEAARAGFAQSVPPLWRALLRSAPREPQTTGTWLEELGGLEGETLAAAVLQAIRVMVARVLLLDDVGDVEVDQPLTDIGLDSLGAVDLCKALGEAVGATLEPELPFDHPTPEALASHLIERFFCTGERRVSDRGAPLPGADAPSPGSIGS